MGDAAPFYTTDPKGFFIGHLKNEMVGCISAVAYDDCFGFIGFYIVVPSYRHQGIGLQLWKRGLAHLSGRIIGLDGVLEQQKNYEKSHFILYYKNARFEGIGGGGVRSKNLIDLKHVPFESLCNYDASIFGIQRGIFLKHWIEMSGAYLRAKVEMGRLRGYGVLRKCEKGYKVGPLFCDDVETAFEIFQDFRAHIAEFPIFLDIPELNAERNKIVEAFHLKSVFQTVRMYNKPPPKQELDKVFGVTTFELG